MSKGHVQISKSKAMTRRLLRRLETRRCLIEFLEPRHLMAGDTNAGVGLLGQYYNNSDLTDLVLTRSDASIAFNWAAGSPDASIGADTFSVRWSGQVEAVNTENYSFIVNSDNGVRLWVNGKLLVDRWTAAPVVGVSGAINLVSGRKYDILCEYFETTGNASVQLDWSSASQPQQSVPTFRLFPSERGDASREVWSNVAGSSIAALTGIATYPNSPNTVGLTNGLQSPTNQADNFGERIRGLIHPPQTGEYTFYIAGDDTAELWLSNSTNAQAKQRIASVPGGTLAGEWAKFPEQRSSVVRLVAGQSYYVEALHKEATGADHLAVGWMPPGASTIELIRGEYLSPILPEVELYAERPATAEGSVEPARMRVVRSGVPLNNALTVSYVLRGSAVNGTDFANLPGSVVIPAGQDYAFVDFAAISDASLEGTETSVIELVDGPGYQLGQMSERTATATIQDNATAPTGGVSLLAGTALGTNFASFGGTFTTVSDTTPPGSVALPITSIQAAITSQPANPWDSQLRQTISGPVKKGDILFAEFLVRSVSGSGSISAIFERNGTPFTKSLDRGLNFSTTWTKVQLPFVSSEDYAAGEATFGFHLGSKVQTIRFGAFNVRNYGPSSDLAPSVGLELNNIGGTFGTMQSVPVTGQSFPNASLITTVTTPPDSWRLQALARSAASVQSGDTLQVEFWARGITGANPRLDIVVQESFGSFTTLSFNTRFLTSNWQKYTISLTTTQAYDVAKLQTTLNAGFAPQSVQVGGFTWTNLTRGYAFSAMPTQSPSSNYLGREGTDPWRTDADARINQIRAAELTVQVRDTSGTPIDGAVVTIRQKKHAFSFGSAINGYGNLLITNGSADALKYQAEIKRLFNTVVVENNLKWPDFLSNRQLGIDAANWAVANSLRLRGHNVIWPSRTYMPASVWSQYDTLLAGQGASVAATYLRNTINARIVDASNTFRGKAVEWDVVNEPFTNNHAMSVLGNDELLEWFRLFRVNDPLARRTLNDYDIFSRNGGNTAHRTNFDYWLGRLDSQSLVETIGEQSHYGEASLTDMNVLAQLIQTYNTTYDLPIAITEFDVNTSNEQLQADYLRDYLTMSYSQPGISQFVQWGFWSKSHYSPQAALYRDDFSIKPNGQVYEDLVFGDWWTDSRGTSRSGQFQTRGSLGDYEVSVISNGQEVVSNATLTAANSTLQVIVPGNRVPTAVQLSNRRIAENSLVNSLVGTLTAIDSDVGNNHTFTLASGTGSADNQTFTIAGNQLRTNASIDFETRSAFSIRVRATDQGGLAVEQAMTVQVENLLETAGLSTDLVVPLYQFPTFANVARTQLSGWWQDIVTTASATQPITVIVNPSNGPIDPQSLPLATDYQIYVDAIRLLRANPNVRVLGYLPTGYGNRAVAQITQFLDWYASGYKDSFGGSLIDGIFLDEYMADASQLGYYRTIRDAIRSRDLLAGKYIMANPGTAISLNTHYTEPVADSFVSYENIENPTAIGSIILANSIVTSNAAAGVEFAAIVHSVASTVDMQRVAKTAKSKGYGQVFITNDVLGNPYDVKPIFWDAAITELHRPVIVPQAFAVSETAVTSTPVGTVQGFDPDPGQTLTYAITQGNVGSVFSISASGNITVAGALDFETTSSYALTVQVTDSSIAALVDTATITVQVADVNEQVVLTASQPIVNGNVLSSLTNSGTWRDPEGANVTLTASLGSVVKQLNGTWNWTYLPSVRLVNQPVTIQSFDGVNTSSVSFSISAIPAVTNAKVYYKDSWFAVGGADVPAALDPNKIIAKSGATPQTLSQINLSNTTQGINGLVLDVAGLISNSLSVNDIGLRMSPTGYFNEAANPPSSWVAAPTPTGIFVTPGTASVPARVRLEWANNAIENRWLQIRVFANANTGLPNTEVYYFGHLRGEIDGEIVAGAYFVSNADLTGVLPVGQLATVSNTRDVDKDRFVLNTDLVVVRTGITSGLILRNITIPAAGSASEGAGTGSLQSAVTLGPNTAVTPQDAHFEDDGTIRYDQSGLAYHFDSIDSLELLQEVPSSSSPSGPSGSPPLDGVVPIYHSNPSFPKKIYLDFDGQLVSGTTWNNQNYTGSYNTGTTINAPAFSTDSDVANYSTSELAAIQEIWARVAEDYAPFQVDVTTEDPGTTVLKAGGQAIRALISTDVDATSGQQWYPNAGGVAYLNSWNWTNGSPVWIFSNRLGNGFAKYVAEAVSHEVGHSFNLGHDGRTSPSEGYYQGHGSGQTAWAPIMGVGYYRSLSQWSKGEYLSANNSQDDLAIISGAVGYPVDDHGNTVAAATQLSIGTSGAIANTGLITTRTDKDAFRFATQTGNVSINVDPFDYSSGKGNLDVELTLVNALGTVVSVVNSTSIINATLTTSLPKGIYTIIVDGVGKTAITGDEGYSDYASIGKYSLSGTVIPNRSPVAVVDSVTTGVGNSILINVLLNDTDADQDTLNILSVGAPSGGTVSIEAGKIRYIPPAAFIGQATFAYTIADELGATSTGSVTVNLIPNVPPTVGVNQLAVSGNEGTLVTNTGTWADTDIPSNTVNLAASIGTIVKNADGTWSWQVAATDQVPATNVIVTANDGLGGTASTSFTYAATNLPPTLTRSFSSVSGSVLTTLANDGTFSDVPTDTVVLSASMGNIIMNANGTWNWSILPSAAINNQTVTVTAQDEDGGSTTVSFVLNAIPAVQNRQVYYKDSWFASGGTDVQAALDPGKMIAKSGVTPQTLSYANLTNTLGGINGLVLDVAGLAVNSLSTDDFGLRMSPTGFFNESTNPPSSWAAAPSPTGIFVTPGTATIPARVRLEWSDNAIENRWLQIRIFAANTGLQSTEVYYVGHLRGEIDGEIVAGAYFVSNADLTAILPVGQLASVNNVRDVDKDRFVLNTDLVAVRTGITSGSILRNITIPSAGSAEEGTGTGNALSQVQATLFSSRSEGASIGAYIELEGKSSKTVLQIPQRIETQSIPASTLRNSTRFSVEVFSPLKAKSLTTRREIRETDAVFSFLANGNFEEKIGRIVYS